jgi:N-methylhydantoinase A
VSVPLSLPASGLGRQDIQAAFDEAYRQAYGRLLNNIPTRVMNYRIAVIGRRPGLDMSLFAPTDGKTAVGCQTGVRRIYADGAFHKAAIYERLDLAVGETIRGPAILEQPDATIYVDPGLVARVDDFGNLVIRSARDKA